MNTNTKQSKFHALLPLNLLTWLGLSRRQFPFLMNDKQIATADLLKAAAMLRTLGTGRKLLQTDSEGPFPCSLWRKVLWQWKSGATAGRSHSLISVGVRAEPWLCCIWLWGGSSYLRALHLEAESTTLHKPCQWQHEVKNKDLSLPAHAALYRK